MEYIYIHGKWHIYRSWTLSGWCIGTVEFYDFPFSWEWNNHPNWLSLHHFSEGLVYHQPVCFRLLRILHLWVWINNLFKKYGDRDKVADVSLCPVYIYSVYIFIMSYHIYIILYAIFCTHILQYIYIHIHCTIIYIYIIHTFCKTIIYILIIYI